MSLNAICIIGPTGSGKTSLAFSLAKENNGEIVNLDKIYTYKYFPIGTGYADNLKETEIKKHLYSFLEPDEEIISPYRYAKLIREACIEISTRGKLPIIEGGSTVYFPALILENKFDPFIMKLVGLRPPEKVKVIEKIRRRVNDAIKEGLLDEVKMGMEKYPNSLIMKDCHFIVPIVKFLNNQIGLDIAKDEVVERCMQYIERQMACFQKFPEVKWKKLFAENSRKENQ